MRLILAAIYLVGVIGPAICQTSTPPPPAQASVSEQIRIGSFQTRRRNDNYVIASFVISNTTDKALNSVELTCWIDDDREHGTKLFLCPSTRSIPAHEQQQFSTFNIGLIALTARAKPTVPRR